MNLVEIKLSRRNYSDLRNEIISLKSRNHPRSV